MPKVIAWVVEFENCTEAIIRTGTKEEASVPNALGWKVKRIRSISDVQLKGTPWISCGTLRCEVTDSDQ